MTRTNLGLPLVSVVLSGRESLISPGRNTNPSQVSSQQMLETHLPTPIYLPILFPVAKIIKYDFKLQC